MIDKIDQLIVLLGQMQRHLEARAVAEHWVDAHIEMQQYMHCFDKAYPLAQAIQKEVAAFKASMGLAVGQNPTPEISKRFGYKAADVLFFYNYVGVFLNSSNPVKTKARFEDLKKYWQIHLEAQP